MLHLDTRLELNARVENETQLSLGLHAPVSPSMATRRRWRHLVEHRLPQAAQRCDWPINKDHCFARVLLDNALGAPWRNTVRPPAWRNVALEDLRKAIELGEAVIVGDIDLYILNAKSIAMRK